ncbi:class I SAM-dependent methyltransferase [Actinomycetes bacterium M1A6_2h]
MLDQTIDGNTLEGVSSTTLYTLYNRATFAAGDRRVVDDPMALRIFDSIDYDWSKFGKADPAAALRSRTFDRATRDFLARNPRATIVALGEGLQTSYWRLGRPRNPWFSIDLEPVMDLRRRVLPDEPDIVPLAESAFDTAWMDSIPQGEKVFVTAEGLLMYFDEASALALIAECAARFPGGGMIFDSIPAWVSKKTIKGVAMSDHYTIPAMPFSMSTSRARRLDGEIPRVSSASEKLFPSAHGMSKFMTNRVLSNLPRLRDLRPCTTVLQFEG